MIKTLVGPLMGVALCLLSPVISRADVIYTVTNSNLTGGPFAGSTLSFSFNAGALLLTSTTTTREFISQSETGGLLANGCTITSATITNPATMFNISWTYSAGCGITSSSLNSASPALTGTDTFSVGPVTVVISQTAMPTITNIVNGASFTAQGAISPASWVAIFGTGLAPAGDSRTWNVATEIINGKLPVSLDGTTVTVNGKSAVVEFIQPSQVNIETPDDTAVGPVQVVVKTAAGATDSFTASYAQFAPGLFAGAAPYIVAQHADNSYVTTATPAKPSEVIILWGTGFGPATPAVSAGQAFSGANPLANVVTVTIGGQPAAIDFAGVIGAGLVQINVHVPSSINNGDTSVVATVGGVSTQMTKNMISVHN